METEIRNNLKACERNYFEVVAFTHADEDHIRKASEIFFLDHAQKYQSDDRIIINEMWVPAAFIVEQNLSGDARVIRAEARHRLKSGYGIRIFSRPEVLKEWLESEGLTLDDRSHLISDAGTLVPGYSLTDNDVEFFIHSTFAEQVDDTIVDRNSSALIFHVTFYVENSATKFMLIGDTDCDVLSDIVEITKNHNNERRLEWDIFDIPHHCSYLALSSEKGKEKTEPIDNVEWLLDQGTKGAYLVSCSYPIPSDDQDNQPPHRQAANCYKDYGNFIVTMEHPLKTKPEPMVFVINDFGVTLKKKISTGASIITSRPAPRAGESYYE